MFFFNLISFISSSVQDSKLLKFPLKNITTKGTQRQRQVKQRIYCPQNKLRQPCWRIRHTQNWNTEDLTCAQFWPLPDYYPSSIGRFRDRCGGGGGLGLGNQIQIGISRRGVIIWQGVKNGHNGKASGDYHRRLYSPEANEPLAAGDYRRLGRYLLKHSTVLD